MPIAWSHSSLQTFLNCPKRFYHERIAKDVKDDAPPHPTTVWGREVHKAMEDYIAKGQPLPSNMAQYQPIIDLVAQLPNVQAEQQYAINTSWQRVDWFAPDVWGRCIIDVLSISDDGKRAALLDYKLGKYRGDTGQARVNAVFLFATHPELQRVDTQFLYLAAKKADPDSFTRDKLVEYVEPTLNVVRQIETCNANNAWHPTPSGLCGYCPVTRCQFNKRK